MSPRVAVVLVLGALTLSLVSGYLLDGWRGATLGLAVQVVCARLGWLMGSMEGA